MPWPFGKLKKVMEKPSIEHEGHDCKVCLLLVRIDG